MIVALAIIALIAVPIDLNIIEKSKERAAETYVVTSELDKNKLNLDKSDKYNVTKNTIIESKNYIKINDLVSLKGSFPTDNDDYVILGDAYSITEARFTINGYEILIKNDEIISIVKGKTIELESIILDKTSTNVEIGKTLFFLIKVSIKYLTITDYLI